MAATDLVTIADYRVITLDTTSSDAAVTAALEKSLDLVEAELDRWLESTSRTETLLIRRDRRVYPKAYPVTVVVGTGTIDTDARSVRDVSADSSPGVFSGWSENFPPYGTLTYTGGYTAATLPEPLAQEIAWRAHDLLNAGTLTGSLALASATSASVGDVSVSGAAGSFAVTGRPSRDELRGYRRVRIP